jgi:lipopolysaccharide exporter
MADPVPPDPAEGFDESRHRELDKRILRGSLWTALGYGGRQVASFVGVLVLVRLVEPSAFGLIALASPFLFVLQYLQESGLSSALVHRREQIERAAATVLVFSPLTSLGLYAITFAAAPLASDILHAPRLTNVLRVLGLLLIIRSLGIAPAALLEREMGFRARAQADVAAAVTQLTTSVALAAAGAGVWSIVAGQLAGESAGTCLYWLKVPQRPNPRDASVKMLRELGRYGRFVGAGNILNVANNTADNMLIGRLLGTTSLGFYSVAFRLALLPNSVIGYVVGRVMFSVYSSLQHDRAAVKRVYLQNLQRIAIFALPVGLMLILAARPIVLTLLGEKWSPAIAPLRILAVFGLVKSFLAPSGEVFKGLGHPKYSLIFEAVFSVPVIAGLAVLVPAYGLIGAPLALLLGLLISALPEFVLCCRLQSIRPSDLASALGRPAAAAALVAIALFSSVELTRSAPPALSLAIAAAAGAVAYGVGTALFARTIVGPMWTNLRGQGA